MKSFMFKVLEYFHIGAMIIMKLLRPVEFLEICHLNIFDNNFRMKNTFKRYYTLRRVVDSKLYFPTNIL